MTHLKHSASPSLRVPYLPILKGSHPAGYFDYDRLLHSPWGHTFPPVNVKENDKSFEIELMVPGHEKKDFSVSVHEEFLTVSAKSQYNDEKKDNGYIQKQFGFSSFTRPFHLPENANEDGILAKYDGRVLTISIPKKNVTISKSEKFIEVK